MNFAQHKAARGWRMWGVLALAFVIVLLHRVSPGVILERLIIDLKIQEAALAGTLAGVYPIVYCLMQIPSGLLADFCGPRKTVTAGMLVGGLGQFIFALAPNLFYALLGRGIVGLGVSVILVSILKFLTSWFKPSQFTTMVGLTMLVGNLGGALGTTPLVLLVQGWGWRKAHLLTGAATFLIAVLCWLIVRDHPQIRNAEKFVPEKRVDVKKEEALGRQQYFAALKVVLNNRHNLPLFWTFFGIYGTLLAFTGAWGTFYLNHVYSFTRQEASHYLLAITIGISIGYFCIGYISDRVSRRKWPTLLFFAIYILVWLLLICWEGGKPPASALYPMFFLLGFSGTANVPLFGSAKELNEPAYSGLAVGIVNIGAFAGAAILQPLWGAILDWKGSSMGMGELYFYPLEAYRFLFMLCLAFLLLCFCLALTIKETKGHNIIMPGGVSTDLADLQNR